MKRFELVIDTPDEFEIDNESMDNIKSYLCYCFKVDNIDVSSCGLSDWITGWFPRPNGIDPEIPF